MHASNNNLIPLPERAQRDLDSLDTAPLTTHTGNMDRQIGALVLEEVQIPPLVPLRVVCVTSFSAATGSCKKTPQRKINLNVQTIFIRIKLTTPHAMAVSNPMSTVKNTCLSC